jgi:hypothetical protein
MAHVAVQYTTRDGPMLASPSIRSLALYPNAQDLTEIVSIIRHLPSLCPLLEHLHLDFFDYQLTDSLVSDLLEALAESLPRLQRLKSFGGNPLGYITLCHLSSLPQLRHFRFYGLSGTDITRIANTEGFPALESVDFNNSEFHVNKDLLGWIRSSSLKSLSVRRTWDPWPTNAEQLNFCAVIASRFATSLRVLFIDSSGFDHDTLQPLLECHRLVDVTLTLRDRDIDDDDLRAIVHSWPELEGLMIYHAGTHIWPRVTFSGISYLAIHTPHLCRLRIYLESRNFIFDPSVVSTSLLTDLRLEYYANATKVIPAVHQLFPLLLSVADGGQTFSSRVLPESIPMARRLAFEFQPAWC